MSASLPASDPTETTHFGAVSIPLVDKQERVNDVFHKVARRYDLMNDLMSCGLHRVWKEALVSKVRPHRATPFHILDMAGGTGDVAFRLLKAGSENTRVTVGDINKDMLKVGQERAQKELATQLTFQEANAEDLPFPDRQFDAYTIAFGIRNVPRIPLALQEAYRVLKHGSMFACLEFSHVDMAGLDAVYEAYSFQIIPRVGQWVTGDAQPYQYLVESIRQFPKPDAFEGMMREAGFARTSCQLMSGGIVALHTGWKI
jgi:demethylmenaquinone methyltransferase / 2-methoxy-6-polyprenyl-1,4-benzoquinol methylase